MSKRNKYELTEVEFKGQAYFLKEKNVLKGSKSGVMSLPVKLTGKSFDVILIPTENLK